MRAYTRPPIEPQEFLDASGHPIPYGTRWAHLGGSPPEDSYSVDSHAERFAPLHTIAAALIDHLAATYDVEVDEDPDLAGAALHPPLPGSIVRAVSLKPASAECAALLIVFTDFPSVRIYAGAFRTTSYPHCSCDACDETWQLIADDLEGEVLSIAAGGLAETIGRRRWLRWSYQRGQGIFVAMRQPVTTGLTLSNGSGGSSATHDAKYLPPAVLARGRQLLAALGPDGAWQPWPQRRASIKNLGDDSYGEA